MRYRVLIRHRVNTQYEQVLRICEPRPTKYLTLWIKAKGADQITVVVLAPK